MVQRGRGIILVGLGPYARSFYYPALETLAQTGQIRIEAVIDVASRADVVSDFLRSRAVAPRRVILIPDSPVPQLIAADLAQLGEVGDRAWGCIIATEPRWHRVYAEWALRSGLRVLLEKPITARDFSDGGNTPADLRADFDALRDLSESMGLAVVVQTQRRVHPAYVAVREWVRQITEQFQVPVTHVALSHADGSWYLPWEFSSRDGHPHRFGYGKLLHSGYHMLDSLAWLLAVNDGVPMPPDVAEVTTVSAGPVDVAAQLSQVAYRTLFGPSFERAESGNQVSAVPETLGETDVILSAALRAGDRVVTTASATMIQTSFSRRASLDLPLDTYKGNGRVRHESLSLYVGPLAAVQATSFSTGDGDGEFVVDFFRNQGLIGGDVSRTERFRPSPGFRSLNDESRVALLSDFLNDRLDRSGIATHRRGVDLLVGALESVAARRFSGGGGVGSTRSFQW